MPLLVLYDGVCGMCNRLVQFVLARDPADRFRFAPLQGELAHALLRKHGRDAGDLDTFYLAVDHGEPGERLLWKARAALRVLRAIGGVWALTAVFAILPTFLLDAVYDFIARRRYGWFGKTDACALPDPAQRHKFL